MAENGNNKPRSAAQWYDLGCIYRKNGEFGKAVNAFRSAVEAAEAEIAALQGESSSEGLSMLKDKATASIELVLRITGFVNKDLMNP